MLITRADKPNMDGWDRVATAAAVVVLPAMRKGSFREVLMNSINNRRNFFLAIRNDARARRVVAGCDDDGFLL